MPSNEKWVQVYMTGHLQQAHLMLHRLEANEVPCQLLNQQDSFYGFGDIKLMVPQSMVPLALHIIQKVVDE